MAADEDGDVVPEEAAAAALVPDAEDWDEAGAEVVVCWVVCCAAVD